MMIRATLLAALAFAALLQSPAAHAQQCRFTGSGNPDLNFGTIAVLPTVATTTAGNIGVSCTGTGNARIKACIGLNSGTASASLIPRQMRRVGGADLLGYLITQDSNGAQPWGEIQSASDKEIEIQLIDGTAQVTVPIYASLVAGQSPPTGIYQSTLIATLVQVDNGNGNANCNAGIIGDTMAIDATARIGASCEVDAGDLTFAPTSDLSGDQTSTSTISVKCPLDLPYRIGLDAGLHSPGGSPPSRRMAHAVTGSDHIGYGLYRDSAHSLPWGAIASGSFAADIGTGAFAPTTVFGLVPGGQGPLPIGTYRDTITVTVEY